MTRIPSNHQNTRVRRQRDTRVLSRLSLLLFSAFVLAGGFVFAARQHFAAVKYGYETEAMRTEKEQLLRQQQQLMLEREQVSAPARLESAARSMGMGPLKANQVGVRREAPSTAPQ